MKTQFTASMLALFLGAFGFHWFYLGKAGRGFAYLLFCWTFVPSFLALIDFVRFLVMNKAKFDAKFNR